MKLFLGLPSYGYRRYNTMPLLGMWRSQKSSSLSRLSVPMVSP